MFLRISFDFKDCEDIKTIEVDISHFSCWFDDQILSLYDHDSSIYDIPLKYIYTFSHIESNDAGIDFTVFRNLDLAFAFIGLKEVNNELT